MMKHALGLDQRNAKPKRGKCTAYRNYFCTSGKSDEWEELVSLKLATSHTDNPSMYYHVSDNGLRLLEEILGFKIIESE